VASARYSLTDRLAAQLSALDDAAFEALSSPGLLGRAKRDLQRLAVSVVDADDDRARLNVGDARVSIPNDGPARGSCDCLALGICRHILVAALFLRESLADGSSVEPTGRVGGEQIIEELLSIEDQALLAWAGKQATTAAVALLLEEIIEVDQREHQVIVRFIGLLAEVRFVGSGSLEAAIVQNAQASAERLVAAAVLAVQRHHGRRHALKVSGRAAPSGAPRGRRAVLEQCSALFEQLVRVGLSAPPKPALEQLRTLTLSARGVHLPRLSRALSAVAAELSLLLRRQLRADESRLLQRLATAQALVDALAAALPLAPAELIGAHRSRYDDVGALSLVCLASYPWSSSGGLRGLSTMFWETSHKLWFSYTHARPHALDEPAQASYQATQPWDAGYAPAGLLGRRLKLYGAKRNAEGRLSSSTESRAEIIGHAQLGDLPAMLETVDELRRKASELVEVGLFFPRPLSDVVAFRPTRWGRCRFDEIDQRLIVPVFDAAEASVDLQVAHVEDDKTIDNLIAIAGAPKASSIIVGRLELQGVTLSLRPWSVIDAQSGEGGATLSIVDLAFASQAKAARSGVERAQLGAPAALSPSAQAFIALTGLLNEIAQGGTSAVEHEELARCCASLEVAGCTLLSQNARVAAGDPKALLRASYLCELHQRLAHRAQIAGGALAR